MLEYLYNTGKRISPWIVLPGKGEFFIIILIYLILLTAIVCGINSYINKKVKKDSRCLYYNTISGIHTQIFTQNKIPLVQIDYDMDSRKVSETCLCPSGTSNNIFTNIPIYDFKYKTVSTDHPSCQCDKIYSNDNIYSIGDIDLNRFYNTYSYHNSKLTDTYFFDSTG